MRNPVVILWDGDDRFLGVEKEDARVRNRLSLAAVFNASGRQISPLKPLQGYFRGVTRWRDLPPDKRAPLLIAQP